VEAALGIAHFAEHVVERVGGHSAIQILAGGLPCFEIGFGQQRIVVEHFLEMRRQPLSIDRVTMKTPANLIVNAAAGHVVQRRSGHVQQLLIAGMQVLTQQQGNGSGVGEFWRTTEAAPRRVEL
jgi:hypothetical protein